jgi:hypothetical protein
VAIKGVDTLETVDDFKARWVAQAKLDLDPSLVTLRLVKCGAGKPTAEQETNAKQLDDPSLSLAEVKVTGTTWVLAQITHQSALYVMRLVSTKDRCVGLTFLMSQACCCSTRPWLRVILPCAS